MKISRIIKEARDIAFQYNLQFVETDRTDNIVSIRLLIDNDLFIRIYGNAAKDKLNLTLVFKKKSFWEEFEKPFFQKGFLKVFIVMQFSNLMLRNFKVVAA